MIDNVTDIMRISILLNTQRLAANLFPSISIGSSLCLSSKTATHGAKPEGYKPAPVFASGLLTHTHFEMRSVSQTSKMY